MNVQVQEELDVIVDKINPTIEIENQNRIKHKKIISIIMLIITTIFILLLLLPEYFFMIPYTLKSINNANAYVTGYNSEHKEYYKIEIIDYEDLKKIYYLSNKTIINYINIFQSDALMEDYPYSVKIYKNGNFFAGCVVKNNAMVGTDLLDNNGYSDGYIIGKNQKLLDYLSNYVEDNYHRADIRD